MKIERLENYEWPEKRPYYPPYQFILGEVNSGRCRRSDHKRCSGFKREWYKYGYVDDPCECSCHDHGEPYKPRLEAHRERWEKDDRSK